MVEGLVDAVAGSTALGDDPAALAGQLGTQGDPFYDGWFVQLLMNQGDGTFIDETSNRLHHAPVLPW